VKTKNNLIVTSLFCYSFILFFNICDAGGLPNVSSIKITSSVGDNLQVSEVIAKETGTGDDLALRSKGATATGSTLYQGSPDSPDYAIDGIGPSAYPNIFHSATKSSCESLLVKLASPSSIDTLTIYGRTDQCSERDVYNVELLDILGNTLFSAQNNNANNVDHIVTITLSGLGIVVKPYTFTSGTPAKAAEVNANFDTLYQQINVLKAIVCTDHPTTIGCK
jgi:hypothetical protein